MTAVNVLELFAGIGGLSLGLERAGMTVVGQVEIDPFCRSVLERHWPEVPKHDDVRTAVEWWRSTVRPPVHLVAGGFPCQPFSNHGIQQGITDERWGWPWMRDIIAAVRPRYVIAENVAALLGDIEAFSIVIDDLSELGFAVEWSVVSACSVGAPHTRERVFVLAYPPGGDGELLVHLQTAVPGGRSGVGAEGGDAWADWWLSEPGVDRVAHGVPKRLVAPENRAIGNAVVPQIGEVVGRLVMGAVS